MGPCDLRHIFGALDQSRQKGLLVGYENSDDAAIFAINEKESLVLTADFITPVVDDPYLFGQIAAANALSDVFAMGGDVKAALNLVCFDNEHFDIDVLKEILCGGQSKVQEAGGVIAGGHTINDIEMKYGLSVTGMIASKKVLRNNSAKPGDVIILTKPLGMGILTTAIKANALKDEKIIKNIASIMAQLNLKASKLALEMGASACTDVTGFGLLGHLYEMINPKISITLDTSQIPFVFEVLEYEAQGMIPGGSYRNRDFLESHVLIEHTTINPMILFDAQTSGGLLIAIEEKRSKELLSMLIEAKYLNASIIGVVESRKEQEIVLW